MQLRNTKNRVCTYRYLDEPALYPFSHGLSYTAFEYRKLVLTPSPNALADPNAFTAEVEVHNTGVNSLILRLLTLPCKSSITVILCA